MRFSFLATLASLALSHAATYGEFNDAWSFDLAYGQYNNWMHYIADGTSLASLTIPGTHNSMNTHIGDGLLQSQNTPLAYQLTGGVRYLDVSCMTIDGQLMVTHGGTKTGFTLDYVLTTVYDFLDANSREAVILRIQKGNALEPTSFFSGQIRKLLSPGTPLGNRAAQRVFSRGGSSISTIPTLGEVRGKVFILQDFDTKSGQFGLSWSSRLISYYHFKFGIRPLLSAKWIAVQSYLTLSLKSSEKLYVTDVTVSVGAKPITFAAGPHDDPGINARLGDYLLTAKSSRLGNFFLGNDRGYFGVIVMDFPGKSVVEQLLKFNKRYEVIPPGVFASNNGFPPAPNNGFPPAANGGFPPAANGGFPPAPHGGFPPAPNNGFPPAPNGGFPPAPNGGFPPAPNGGFPPPPNGGFTPAPNYGAAYAHGAYPAAGNYRDPNSAQN